MRFHILNREEVNLWVYHHVVVLDHNVIGETKPPPKGLVYDDGRPITNPITVAWVDTITGEKKKINYEFFEINA